MQNQCRTGRKENKKLRIVFWGTGNTAKKYIDRIKRLSDRFEVVAFTDSCQNDNNTCFCWEGFKLIAPKAICELDVDLLCILSIWEWEIRRTIYEERVFDLSRIISFHEICMMDSFDMELDICYEKELENMHPQQKESAEMWRDYEYLKRKYSYVLCDKCYWKIEAKRKAYFEKDIRPIWILWLQGMDRAPELVEICIRSLKRALGDKEFICLLDAENVWNYIDLPDYIVQKWENGVISNTHFSDLIRLRLLNVYGGIWIDATVYFTGSKLPDYMKNSKLFMFNMREHWSVCTEPRIAANWLISAQSENKMLIILEALLHEYWKRENRAINYYFFHIFWTMVVECRPKEWEQVENVIRDPAQLLNGKLTKEFQEDSFEYLKQMSDIHKLSYKEAYMDAGKNSFWAKLCEIDRRNR